MLAGSGVPPGRRACNVRGRLRRQTMSKAGHLALAVLLALPALAQTPAPSPSPAARPKGVEARALTELQKMSDFLKKAQRFALEAEESYDEIADGEPKVELTNLRRIAVERPGRLAADATGDTVNRAAWFDGRSFTLFDKENNVYAT